MDLMISFGSFVMQDIDEFHRMRLIQIRHLGNEFHQNPQKSKNILYNIFQMYISHFALSTFYPLSQENDRDIDDFTVSLFICSWFNNLDVAVDEI